MKRNPFRVLERIGAIVGWVILSAFVALAVAAVVYGLAVHEGWGWWTLLLLPGAPIGLIVIAAVAGLLRVAADSVHDWWLMSKWRWDDRHKSKEAA